VLIIADRPAAIGNHHLEYGFPSTHSTNSVSIALYCHSLLYASYAAEQVSDSAYVLGVAVCLWYTFSIVFGRLYTGMHSITDCIVGSILGSSIWWVHMTVGQQFDEWITTSGWEVPLVLVAFGTLPASPVAEQKLTCIPAVIMINQHPQPVDDCPCFEDAIACVAVVAGVLIARWSAVRAGLSADFYQARTPGWQKESWEHKLLWVSLCAVKLVGGVLAIAVWRIVAKFALHAILPPIFRALARITVLPTRRFYIPATDYNKVPKEKTLQPIPSVIDLPSTLHAHSMGNLALPRDNIGTHLKQRKGAKSGMSTPAREDGSEFTTVDDEPLKHYDADGE